MKSFKLFFLVLLAALPVLQSCNDSDTEGADSVALVTINNPGGLAGTFHFTADNGQTLYPSEMTDVFFGYNPDDGQRALIYYSLLDTKKEGYDYNIKLYALQAILTKEVEPMDPNDPADVEKFGEDPIEVAKINTVYDCLISGGYLTLTYNIYATLQGETHKISLVRNTHDTDTEEPEYTMLELRHKAEASIEDAGKRSGVVSFKLGEYDPAVTNKKGILLRVKHLDESETEEYIKINYEK